MQTNDELLKKLSDVGIELVVIGGVAAVLHGSATATRDLDVCVPFTPESFARILPVLRELHARFRVHPDQPPLTGEPERFVPFRHLLLVTDLGWLDLLREVAGVGGWREVVAASETMDIAGAPVRVLTLEALVRAKRATGRDRDLRALPELEALLDLRRQPDH